MVEIINKKRLNESLSKEEINYVISEYTKGNVEDYQMSSWLMAICINNMSDDEIFFLTEAMLNSGEVIDLSGIDQIKVDKHSTGGIGDKTTIVLLPLVASTGVCVPKMSGRSLGYTGGTIDKLESIPGFKTNLDINDFVNQVNKIGVALASQTGNLVPADKKIYSLRDVTGTVESIPLIASSIMSKKLASSADKIVIDLKVGSGALMKTIEDATRLANVMVNIGKKYNRETVCVLTNMDEPLGNAIGNALEVVESIETLKGNGPKDLEQLVITLGTLMVSLGKNISEEEAEKEVTANLKNGLGYNKLIELINAQGGDLEGMKVSNKVYSLKSKKTGIINQIHSDKLGEEVRKLGGGRYTKEDVIDHSVGIILSKKVGDFVMENEELLKVYWNNLDVNINEIIDCFVIEDSSVEVKPLIYKIIK